MHAITWKTTAVIVAGALAGVFGPGLSQASHQPAAAGGQSWYADAEVVRVEPIIQIVQVSAPRETCWNEQLAHRRYPRGNRSHTSSIVGGIIGGVVGNQFGSGRGNDIMTAAGALLGASIGRDANARRHARPGVYYTTERRCEVEESYHEEERLTGYRVTYVYDGREFITRMDHNPGERIRIRVQASPLAYN